MRGLYDEDGIDGPFERRMQQAMREDAKAKAAAVSAADTGTRPAPCTCGRIQVGMETTTQRTWRADCPEHGRDSEWYRSGGGAKLDAQAARAAEWQRRAAEARRLAANYADNAAWRASEDYRRLTAEPEEVPRG